MDRLLGIFEDSILMIRERRFADLSTYYNNETIPTRVKTTVRSIQALVEGNPEAAADPFLLVALARFKDGLSIGDLDDLRELVEDGGVPKVLRDNLREILLLFESRTEQMNSMF